MRMEVNVLDYTTVKVVNNELDFILFSSFYFRLRYITINILRMQHGEGAKGNNDMIGYTKVVLVSTSYSKCSILTFSYVL